MNISKQKIKNNQRLKKGGSVNSNGDGVFLPPPSLFTTFACFFGKEKASSINLFLVDDSADILMGFHQHIA